MLLFRNPSVRKMIRRYLDHVETGSVYQAPAAIRVSYSPAPPCDTEVDDKQP